MHRNRINYILNVLALSLFTLRCSQTSTSGVQASFSHVNYFLNQRGICEPVMQLLKYSVYSAKPNCDSNTAAVGQCSLTRPVKSPAKSACSVKCCPHANVLMHILHSVPSATVRAERFTYHISWEGLTFNLQSLTMGNLNCCSGGRFPLILWGLFLPMGCLIFSELFSLFFFHFHHSSLSIELQMHFIILLYSLI